MNAILKPLAAALVAVAAISMPLAADARGPSGGGWHGGPGYHGGGWGHPGYWHGGYWGPGPFWGGIGLGLGIGAIGYYGAPYYGYPGYVVSGDPGYVVVDPAVTTYTAPAVGQPVPAAAHAPDPIFYPRNGQSAAKTETDRQDCNRWATTQAGAMNDASIFQRATFACMEGRGYTVK
jgi:hypothetical protein